MDGAVIAAARDSPSEVMGWARVFDGDVRDGLPTHLRKRVSLASLGLSGRAPGVRLNGHHVLSADIPISERALAGPGAVKVGPVP
jgi:hypothetical protein